MTENKWEIIDNKGTIYNGSQEEMENLFLNAGEENAEIRKWYGDLKLIEIHDIKR